MQISSERPAAAHKAKRRIWIGAVVAIAIAAVAAAVLPKVLRGGDKDKKEPVPLEFIAAEVARPVAARAAADARVLGPAGRAAHGGRSRQGGGDAALAQRRRRQPRQGRPGDRRDRPRRPAEPRRRPRRPGRVGAGRAGRGRAPEHRQRRPGGAELHLADRAADVAGAPRRGARRSSSRRRRSSPRRASASATRRWSVPISGIVGKRHVVPGEKVSAEQQIVTVVDLLVARARRHRSARTRCRCSSRARWRRSASKGRAADVAGRIDRIAPAAEAGTRAIGVVVALDNKGERFRAGQYAQARVELADAAERLTVPSGAVGQASGQDFVWAIEKGALVRRIVVTGRRDAATRPRRGRQGARRRRADPRRRASTTCKEGAPAKVVAQRSVANAASGASAPAGSSPSASASAAPVSRS